MVKHNTKGTDQGSSIYTEESIKNLNDPLWRLTNLYKHATLYGESKVFWPNRVQADIEKRWTGRGIILKARQHGVSTYFLLRNLDTVLWNPNTWCAIIAHERRTLDILFSKIQFAWDNLPPEIKSRFPEPRTDSKHELFWRELNSKIYVALEVVGGTNQIVHFSEYSRIDDDKINATLPTIPPNGQIIIESTPYGAGNRFHREYIEATRGENDYQAFFYPWWWRDDYRREVKAVAQENLTQEELALVENHGLQLEQIEWRRQEIKRQQRSDGTNLFAQEFVEDDISCFLASSEAVFDMQALEATRAHVSKNSTSKYAFLKGFIGSTKENKFKFVEDQNGPLKVWEAPKFNIRYAIGVDLASGTSAGDFSTAQVIRCDTEDQVAEYKVRQELGAFAYDIALLGKWYNTAFVCPERNTFGTSFLSDFLDLYPMHRIYQEDERIKIRKKPIGTKYGFYVGRRSKYELIVLLQNFVRDGQGEIRSLDLIEEMMNLQKFHLSKVEEGFGTKNKYNHHDDLLMAFALALEMARHVPAPRQVQSPFATHDPYSVFYGKNRFNKLFNRQPVSWDAR